jgi:DNA-binding transcriptional MerR regulator
VGNEPGSHLSIGEVLSLLKDEFPDVTISKIRFLESQGLIDPERTPSGYRKFYEPDIDRLRWVLRQQRDHFLPLKVIKARLDQGGVDFDEEVSAQPNLFDDAMVETTPVVVTAGVGAPSSGAKQPAPSSTSSRTPVPPASLTPSDEDAPPVRPGIKADESATEDPSRDPAAWLTALQEAPRPSRRPPASRPVEPLIDPDEDLSSEHYGTTELAAAAGVSVDLGGRRILKKSIVPASFGGVDTYDDGALSVVHAAAAFVGRGIEPRHLRSYKLAAEREAGLFEQLALPLLRQRNPQSRRQAAELVSELSSHGESLRRALLRQAMRSHVTPR